MRFYKNKDTGQILKEPEARAQWRDEYDGDDPTNAVNFYNQYQEATGRESAIAQINYVIETHEPADSYKYMLLDRMKTDCGYFLGTGNRNPATLWAGSVGTHLECMHLLWNSFPEDSKPQWLTLDDLDSFAQDMERTATE